MTPSPLERAARAAYTRPDSTLPWERRTPARRAYWRTVARRALDAGLDREELARALYRLFPHMRRADLFAAADVIRAHVLAPAVHVIPDTDPGRVYGQGYDGGWDDESTAAEAARVARTGGRPVYLELDGAVLKTTADDPNLPDLLDDGWQHTTLPSGEASDEGDLS